jgi:hypothetical protein
VEEEGLFAADGNYLFHTHAPALGNSVGRTQNGGLRVAIPALGEGNYDVDTLSASRSLLGQLLPQGRADKRRRALRSHGQLHAS